VAERRVAVLVPNLFTRVPVDTAVRSLDAVPVSVASLAEAGASGCRVVVIDLGALGDGREAALETLAAGGKTVLAFGPHVDAARLAAARRSGAVVLPRGAFLARLPELLASALGSGGR